MSGPKSYIPPKQYSIKVFDGKLNEIFCLQSDIIQIFAAMNKFRIDDNKRNIYFNCEDFVQENQHYYNELKKAFKVDYKGKFGQEKYDGFKEKIDHKAKQLNEFLIKLKKEKNDFSEKREDYNAYISYEEYHTNALNALKDFKSSILNYIKENLNDKELREHKMTIDKIEQFEPKIKKLNFDFAFHKTEKEHKQKISRYISENETMIAGLKNKILKSVLLETLTKNKAKEKNQKIVQNDQTEEIKSLTIKIKNKIETLEDIKLQISLRNELENLKKSEVFKDVYFYKEFYDKIKEKETDQAFKKKLKEIIYEINYIEISSCFSKEKNLIIKSAIKMSESETIKQNHFNDLESRFKQFKEENAKEIQKEYIQKEENEFLKAQLIKGLQNMNYQVSDDTEVIDFEKQSEFLLKVPKQNNYINLRVAEDNSISYNFLIEEEKDNLSIEQKRKKIFEMETTCNEFKAVLEDLKKMGLDLDQIKDTETSAETLMQLPKKYRDKLKQKEEQHYRIQHKETKKKYLE